MSQYKNVKDYMQLLIDKKEAAKKDVIILHYEFENTEDLNKKVANLSNVLDPYFFNEYTIQLSIDSTKNTLRVEACRKL